MVNRTTLQLSNSDYIKDTWIEWSASNPLTAHYVHSVDTTLIAGAGTDSSGGEEYKARILIAFKIPKPNLPNPTIKSAKIKLYFNGFSYSGTEEDLKLMTFFSQEDGWIDDIGNTCWNEMASYVSWPSDSGGRDTTNDYGFGANGYLYKVMVFNSTFSTQYYDFDITNYAKRNNLEFDKWYGFVIAPINSPSSGNTLYASFNSMEASSNKPIIEIEVEYDDMPKIQNLEITPYEKNKKLGVVKWDELKLEDWARSTPYIEIYRDDLSSPLATNKGTQIYDFGNDKEDTIITDSSVGLPITGTPKSFYAKLNMTIDVGSAYYDNSTSPPTIQTATPEPTISNKVTLIAPTVDDTHIFDTVENGLYRVDVGAVLIGNNLSATVTSDGGRGKFTVDIDWGDGTKSTELEHYQALVDSAAPGAVALGVKAMDAGYFKKGDIVALVDVSSWSYELKTVNNINGTTIGFDSAYSITPTHVITAHRHYYTKQATYNISIVAYNDLGFASTIVTIPHALTSTNPPTAVISVSNYEPRDGDTFYVSLKNSYSNKGGTISTYKFAAMSSTNPLFSDSSPIKEYKIKIVERTNFSSATQIQVVGISSNARIVGEDSTGSEIVEIVSDSTLTTNSFALIKCIELENTAASQFTVQDGSSNVLFTYPSGGNFYLHSYSEVNMYGIVDDGDTDTTFITIYPRIEYYIDLGTALKDVIESVKIPHARNYYTKEGIEYNAVRLGGKKIQVFNISGSAYTNNGYTSCTLGKGTVSFSGSGGNTPDDILLLKAIIDDGYHMIKFTIEEQDYYGWLVSVNINREAGNYVWRWDGTVVIIP